MSPLPLVLSLVVGLVPSPQGTGVAASVAADSVLEGTFLDPVARELLERARGKRREMDESLLAYEAVVTERLAAGIRAFRRDRTVYRKETSTRVRWSRDGPAVVLAVAAREEHPGGVQVPDEMSGLSMDQLWDPEADPLLFGSVMEEDDDGEFIHPLRPGSEEFYRYETGDTLTLRFPDGRTLEAVELRFIPRERDFRRLAGSAWLESASGDLVRAVFRLGKVFDLEEDLTEEELGEDGQEGMDRVPGIFKPIQFELRAVVVDYSLWDFRYWLPRLLRADGVARAGIVEAPASFEVSYRILDTVTEDEVEAGTDRVPPAVEVLADWGVRGEFTGRRRRQNGRRVELIVPEDERLLLESPELPPPIWEEAGPSLSGAELNDLYERLSEIPDAPSPELPWTLVWGPDRPDLLRYNKVEALSVGARLSTRLGGWDARLTGRVGITEPLPDAELRLRREAVRRTWEVSAYHGLASVDLDGRALTLGHSLNTLVLGRDDGEYYRRMGASLALLPPATERPWRRLELYAERHEAVETETDVSLPRLWDGNRRFGPNIVADEVDQAGALLRLRPWWGRDMTGVQGGLDLLVQGETGDMEFARASLGMTLTFPLGEEVRGALEAAGGTAWGDVPVQRSWYLGGPGTLRGYDGSSAVGESYLRGRAELAWWHRWGSVALFSDAGWAGDRDAFDADRGLLSAGVGLSTLDGLVRMDVARALRHGPQWRFELYLDGLL